MQFKSYMQKNKPVYMYLHGECLSAFSFQEEIRELKKDYTLIVPILDGHGGEARSRLSVFKIAQSSCFPTSRRISTDIFRCCPAFPLVHRSP